jgi:TonB-linked SusC/RagA family outer membrane protein
MSVNTWSIYSSTRSYSPYYYDVEAYNQITGVYKLYNLNPQTGSAFLGPVSPGRDASAHYYFEGRVNWVRQFDKHTVGAMLVGIAEESLLTGGNSASVFETLPARNSGLSGRTTYNFDERYFFEFAFGYNGSEKFTGDKKFGFFPSVGAAWIVSNEAFWTAKDVINNLKLKLTWGKVGNDAIAGRAGRFWFLSDIQLSGGGARWGEDLMNGVTGYTTARYANPDISWEESQKYNLGIEVGLLKNGQLKIQADIFKDFRNNIYIQRDNIPATAGLEAVMSGNSGKVESQGLEGSIDFQHSFNKDFWMTARVNFTYAVNKYVALDEKNYPDKYMSHIGYNTNQIWGLVAERLFVDETEILNSPRQDFGEYMAGDIKYSDVNHDGVVDGNDVIPIGYPNVPEIQYGFGISTGYKKFDLSFFFQGNEHVSMYIHAYNTAPLLGRRNSLKSVANNYWSETNPDVHAFWPRLSTYPVNNNILNGSTWWLRNSAFLRLKTIEAGYNLSALQRLSVQNARIYLSVENVFAVSRFKLWDPEMGESGLGYPLNRRFNVGIQLSF